MAKGSFVGCLVLQRIVLPLVLAFSIFFRPVALTLPNLFLLLWLPLVPIATPKTIRGHTGIYLKIVIAISVLTVITQIAFQITLAALGESLVPPCSFLEILLRHIGLIRLTSLAFLDIFIWYLPDVVMPIFSIACFIFIKKMAIGVQGDAEGQPPIEQNWDANEHEGYTAERLRFLKRLCAFVCLAALLLAAILRPSIPGGLYFIVFLGAATWWGCHKELDRAFAYICRFIMVILAVHIIAVLTYQTPWPQEYFPANYTITRYLGFSQLVQSTCDDDKTIRVLVYNTELDFDAFLNPVTMLLSFYLMAIATGFILRAKAKKDRPESDEPNEKTPLMRRSMKGLKNLKKRGPSALLGHNEGIPLEELEEEVESVGGESDADDGPGFMASIWYGLQQFGAFIYRNSYVFTNITMMAWSIVFHSWLTFLYLIWANLIWVLPNQRQSMLRSSPFIVLYAEFLLIAQYIYGMNLTEDELPSKTTGGVNIHQIGFIRYERWPSGPIFLKTMFTILFWASLRQLIQEEKAKKQSTTLANMVAPLQVTVGAAAAELAPQTVEKKPALMIKIGEFVNKVLVRFWVWILIIALFTSAVTGNRMTAFRIIYMALFLIFMVTFQISWRIWKRMMYPFWIVVIGYAMSILILVYTYQFDGFNDYWEYIGIPQKLQSDLGLERYHTKQLFLHLVNPTLVVVMTVVQVHYFHQYYMKIFDLPTTAAQAEGSSTSSGEPNDEKNLEIEKQKQDAIDLESWSRNDIKKTLKNKMERYLKIVIRELQKLIELVWIFLELHLVKAIMLCAFLLSVADVCVLHTFLVILSIVGVVGKSQIKTPISRVLSVVMAILLIGKMIYQIEYIDHSSYDPDCNPSSNATTNSTVPVVYNTAEWIGFRKIVDKTSLAYLVRGYLFYIILTSFHAFVNFRQKRARFIKGLPMKRPYVLFPDISRNEADIDTLHMIKYLFNYGFYKFGIEFTMIANVALIGFRMDIVAVFYSVWLWILFSISRETKVRYFRYFKWFITGLIPVQYILFVGLPPLLCLEYPWSTPMMKNLQEFMLLPDPTLRFDAKKLILDFVLLYITTRQYLVFKMEIWDKENPDIIYPGGSNDEILEEIEELGHTTFKNPMEDYITKTKNWLDIFKKALFTGLFWLTLSIVFLTGTNRTNLFSIGYLVGSFIFLWQGSDFYLRPIRVINKWWSYLVTYNVVVITLKAILQVPGCIFIHELEKSCCWLIQLMGVRCIRKFGIKDQRELECIVPTDGVGLFWDGICFGFLLLQLRMFQSFYFCHVIDDTKATTILASRGAELIEALRQKEMKSQLDHEEAILGKIKQKMDRIKANQQRVLSPIREPGTHFEGFIEYEGRLYRPKSVPITYKDAIRSGDYYMFEDLDEKVELELINLPPMTMSEDAAIPPEKLANKRTLEESDPRPGSSKDSDDKPPRDDDDEPTYESEPMPEQKRKDKLASAAKFVYAFISGLLLSVAVRLYKLSKNYRYVMKVLWKEKRALKVSKIHSDEDSAQPWTELHHRFRQTSAYVSEPNSMPTISATASVRSQTESRNVANTDEVMLDDSSSASSSRISLELETEIHRRQGSSRHTHKHAPVHSLFQLGEEDERRTSVVPEIRILAPSLERGLDDSSPYRLNTYELTVSKELTEIDSDDFTAKEHPVVIELLFAIWFALLSYTDLLCYCVIFMNMVHSQSVLALPLPIMVFLWGTLTVPRPSKTFWVTIVAYTQVVVIIKCFAQFELFWRNRVASPDNQPLAADKILGLERQTNYASYDLFLLLVIFFHRFVLKSLGLWKSEVVEEKIPQGFYHAETQEQSDDDEDSHPKPSTNGEAKETVVLRQGHLALALTKADLHEVVGDDTKPVLVTNVPEEPSKYFPKIVAVSTKKYCSSITTFFKSLLNRVNRVTADIYAFMFLCDFINFLVLVFGFTAFGSMQGDGGVTSYLEENKVPITFLIMLLLQFVLIIVDRALYLRKFLFGKLVFQFLAVFGMHIWMFFIVPAVSERSFNTKRPPVVYYYIKCLYFLLSAYQIRCGYPTRILGNFLTKGYSIFNLGAFKAYMAMPFLFELRTLMDWIWTDTSMTLMDWLKMEDIFATIFNLKCSRQLEEDLPAARGRAKPALVKYFMGGGFLIAVVLLIWFPLALFALGNTVGKPNIPFDVSVTLRIGPYEPIYIMSAQQSNIHKFKEGEWAELNRQYKRDKTALTFLSSYESEDIAAIILGSNSSSTWNISPPDRKRLLEDLKTNATLTCRFKYTISRISYSKDNPGEANDEQEFVLEPDNPNRFQLAAMLEGDQVDRMTLPQLLPKFLKVKNNGDLKPIPQLMDAGPDVSDEDASFRNLLVKFHQSKGTDGVEYIWWEVKEDCSDNSKVLQNLPYADCNNNMILYTFNDKLFPSSLSWLTGGGIIGIYTSFVFIASRVIRGIFAEGSAKIMFDDLPYVDRILQLCLDIYLVRESQEFALEEDLFAKLIFLYRSPETMIKWTRPLDENVNSEDEDDDDNPKANRGNDDDDLGSDVIQRRPKKAT